MLKQERFIAQFLDFDYKKVICLTSISVVQGENIIFRITILDSFFLLNPF